MCLESTKRHARRLPRIFASLATLCGLLAAPSTALAQACEAREHLHAQALSGEAHGERDLVLDAAPGLRLALQRAHWGWRIAVLDDAANDRIPPSPMRGLPDPRELYGWHFRNADNTGPNTGDVNAPQHERRFAFLLPNEHDTASGIGWLTIDDFALTDLAPGQQARMMYLRFSACLMWPRSADDIRAEADLTSLAFLPEEEQMMRACGLGEGYVLETLFPPRMVSGDFDGDGALDHAAYVRRLADGRRGAAVCRAGASLHVLGVDSAVPGSPMEDGYVGQVEAWQISTMSDVPSGWEGEAPRPPVTTDVLVLERVEKALYSLYWDGAAFRSHQHFRHVEP